MLVGHRPVGVSRPVSDPGAGAREQDRLDGGDQTAGRYQDGHSALVEHMHVGFAVRDDKEPTVLQFSLHADAQALRRPAGFARVSEPRFLFCRRTRRVEAAYEIGHFTGKRLKDPVGRQGRGPSLASMDRSNPSGGVLNLIGNLGPHDEEQAYADEQRLQESVQQHGSRHARALLVDLAPIVDEGQHSEEALVEIQGQGEHMQRRIARANDLTDALPMLLREGERIELVRQLLQPGRRRHGHARRVVDGHSQRAVVSADSLGDPREVRE